MNADPPSLELTSSRETLHRQHADRAELDHRRRQAALHAEHRRRDGRRQRRIAPRQLRADSGGPVHQRPAAQSDQVVQRNGDRLADHARLSHRRRAGRACPAPAGAAERPVRELCRGCSGEMGSCARRWRPVATQYPPRQRHRLANHRRSANAPAGRRVWSYDVAGFAQGRKTLAPLAGLRVLSVAAVRHPLEVDTPEALNWSAELTYAATTEAQNVVLTVTHDTLTASWDKQPYARDQGIHAILELEATGGERRLQLWEEEGVSGRHEVTIGDLPPETDFTFAIVMVDTSATSGNPFRRAVRTKPAPPGWIPLPTGAQNLRVTSSDDGHTISWDPPSPHSARSWALRVDNVATGRNVFHTFTSGATTWTISRDRLFSSARYRVTVVHFDLNRIETSIEFNTSQSPRIGQRGARSTGGGIEQQMFAFFSVWPRGWWRSALITTDPTTWRRWVSALLSLQARPRENH